ncbi:hypothetical protein [Floccifex sp.]|uniref:hypothetical protein n=1 Tax=Floccifex sp. TaxID=2815810 RepID=UPI003F05BE97
MKKLILYFIFCLALTGCQKGLEPTKEDCLEVALDDSNVTESEVIKSSTEEKKGNYIIVFETENGHYEYTFEKDGTIKDRTYKALKEQTEKEQEQEEVIEEEINNQVQPETNTPDISAENQAKALEAACINMGISTSDPQNVKITKENGSLVVRFDFGENVTYVTLVDPVSFTATSSYSES